MKGLLADKATAQEWADREALVTLRPLIMEAEDEVGIARAAIPIAETALADALAREEQDRRQTAYNAAVSQLTAAEQALTVEYPSLAFRIREIVALRAQADALVEKINEDLPTGAEPLRTLFEAHFGWLGLPEEVIEAKPQEVWVSTRTGQVWPIDVEAAITENADGTASIFFGHDTHTAFRAPGRRVKYLPATRGRMYDGFSNTLCLPGLAEEATIYRPAFSDGHADVLGHLRELDEEAAAFRPLPRTPAYRLEVVS